jgi:hypothetical protein
MCSSRTLRAIGLYVGLPLRDERTCSVCGSNDANDPFETCAIPNGKRLVIEDWAGDTSQFAPMPLIRR